MTDSYSSMKSIVILFLEVTLQNIKKWMNFAPPACFFNDLRTCLYYSDSREARKNFSFLGKFFENVTI